MNQASAVSAVDLVPKSGALVSVRNRPAKVESVEPCRMARGQTLNFVEVAYTDAGVPKRDCLLWELERTGSVPETRLPLVERTPPMSPRTFETWLRARQWNHVLPHPGMPDVPRSLHPDESHPVLLAPQASAVQPRPYQLVPLVKALQQPRIRLLIADDVGLGKTIEAGLILKELTLRRRISRVLIVSPPGLRRQWKEELSTHFDLPFHILDRDSQQRLEKRLGPDINPFRQWSMMIISPHYLKEPSVLSRFTEPTKAWGAGRLPFDLLLVDEAHHFLPQPHCVQSDLLQMLRTIAPWFEHRIFMTATPHNGYRRSFNGLLEVLDPLRFQATSVPTPGHRKALKEVVIRRTRKEVETHNEDSRRIHRLAVQLQPEEQALLDATDDLQKFLRTLSGTPGAGLAPALAGQTLSKRLLSSPRAFETTWKRFKEQHGSPADVGDLTAIKGWARRMKQVDDTLTDYKNKAALDSRYAAFRQWMADYLLTLTKNTWNQTERCVVFTEYRATLEYLHQRVVQEFPELAEHIVLLHGEQSEQTRRNQVRRFTQGPDNAAVLLSTDAGSEGLNLHRTARLLYHYDLPWNPARLEQRTGRLDRHSQTRRVEVFLPHTGHAIEQSLFQRLEQKQQKVQRDLGSFAPLPRSTDTSHAAKSDLFGDIPGFGPQAPEICTQRIPPDALVWQHRLGRHLGRTESAEKDVLTLLPGLSALPLPAALNRIWLHSRMGTQPFSRWTATRALLPPPLDILVVWWLHIQAVNGWGEIVHDWVTRLSTPMQHTALGWRVLWKQAVPPSVLFSSPVWPVDDMFSFQSGLEPEIPTSMPPEVSKQVQHLWPTWKSHIETIPSRISNILTHHLSQLLRQGHQRFIKEQQTLLQQHESEVKLWELRSSRSRLREQLKRLESDRRYRGFLFPQLESDHRRWEAEIRLELQRSARNSNALNQALAHEKRRLEQRGDDERFRLAGPVQVHPEALCFVLGRTTS